MNDLKPGIYQHYKGPFYLCLGVAHHENTTSPTFYIGRAAHSETHMQYEVHVALDRHLPRFIVHLPAGTPTGKLFALYVPLYQHQGPGMSIRPLSMFQEYVPNPDGMGDDVPRFRYLGHSFPPYEEREEPMVDIRINFLDQKFGIQMLGPAPERIGAVDNELAREMIYNHVCYMTGQALDQLKEALKVKGVENWKPGSTPNRGGEKLHVAPFGIRPRPDGQGTCSYQIYNIDTGENVGDAYPYEQKKDAFRDCRAMNAEWLKETGGYGAIEQRSRDADK